MGGSPFSVLVIDDNMDDGFLAKRAILKTGASCIVEVATDGHQAKERLRDAGPFSLILLDFKMPEISGLDILKFIRTFNKTRFTPVVMLSSSRMEDDVKAAYSAGANSYLRKDLDLSEFTAKLTVVLRYWIELSLSPIQPRPNPEFYRIDKTNSNTFAHG
jgi:two-component system response regulator